MNSGVCFCVPRSVANGMEIPDCGLEEFAIADSQTSGYRGGFLVGSDCEGRMHVQIDDLSLLVLHFGGLCMGGLTGDGEVGGGWNLGGS